MKKFIFIYTLLFSFAMVAQTKVTKNLGDYTILKVYNGIEVELIKSTEQKLEITGAKSEMVKIKIVNDILKLSLPFSIQPEDNAAEGKIYSFLQELSRIGYNIQITLPFRLEPTKSKIDYMQSADRNFRK